MGWGWGRVGVEWVEGHESMLSNLSPSCAFKEGLLLPLSSASNQQDHR